MATYAQIVEANRATFAAWNVHDAIRERAVGLLVAFPDFRLRQLALVVGEDAAQ